MRKNLTNLLSFFQKNLFVFCFLLYNKNKAKIWRKEMLSKMQETKKKIKEDTSPVVERFLRYKLVIQGRSPKTVEEYVERYTGLTDVLINTPKVCGLCYTQLYDVEQEQNGIYYYDRSPKFTEEVMDKLAAVLNRPAAIEEEDK